MKQLSDILREKAETVGGKAELGRKVGVSGQAILQYINGAMPSFDVAIKWKQVFNENLIELMFGEKQLPMAEESIEVYEKVDLLRDLVASQKETIAHLQEKIKSLEKGQNPVDTGKKPRRH